MDVLDELDELLNLIEDVPTYEKMPKRTLASKGIAGPTSAHVIEELHVPFNFEYLSITTGTSAFQNITGIVKAEIADRVRASHVALELSGVKRGDKILVTYPPLVNVFSKEGLDSFGVTWSFLKKSSRDALIFDICRNKPNVIIGESSFIRTTLDEAQNNNIKNFFPTGLIIIVAGTPLDLELLEIAKEYENYKVHDLYGTQEFGWICLDGIELREDISFIATGKENVFDLIVGGLPTGDRFSISEQGHICNNKGKILTYSKQRVPLEYETIILSTKLKSIETIERVAKTILRIKSKIVRVSEHIKLGCSKTVIGLKYYNETDVKFILDEKTQYIDCLIQAQLDYQMQNKKDLVWNKRT